ncbi:MAG: TRAP transporter TatT component family protein [Elusimicrobiales bacterium]|nr:TRAP transporter TatT component family protein [Elusimicrobiales bacterium]
MKGIFIVIVSITIYSCSVKSIALKETSYIIDKGIEEKIYSEDNLIYLRDSLLANLKMLEVLYNKNEDIRIIKNLSMGLCGYAYTFWQSEKDIANNFYIKGIRYSEKYIKEKNISLLNSNEDVKKLFLAVMFCKLAYVDSNLDEPEALEMVSDIEEISQNLYKLNPNYFNGFVAAVSGFIYASKPKIIGGDINKAKELLEQSIKSNGKDFLLNKYLYMRFAALTLDEVLFEKLYSEITSWENNNYPYAFFNKIAQLKAKKLKEKKDDYF